MAQRFKPTTVAILLLAAILLGSLIIFLPANFAKAAVDDEVYDAGLALFRHTVAPLSDENYTIYSKQEIEMFNGDIVSVYDLNPNGYFIYHSESDSLMEFALDTHSPFDLIEGDKYYLAPSYYIEKNNDEYKDLISSNVVARESVSELADISENAVTAIKEEKIAKQEEIRKSKTKSGAMPLIEPATLTQIKHPEFFADMTSCGFSKPAGTEGICGYIACGMIMAYKSCYNYSVMPNMYYDTFNPPNLYPSLSEYLYNKAKGWGYSFMTTATTIKNFMLKMVKEWNIPNFEFQYSGIGALKDTVRLLLNKDQPVMLGGAFWDPQSGDNKSIIYQHWVVAYKLYEHELVDYYVSHFGWDVSGQPKQFNSIYMPIDHTNSYLRYYSMTWSEPILM